MGSSVCRFQPRIAVRGIQVRAELERD